MRQGPAVAAEATAVAAAIIAAWLQRRQGWQRGRSDIDESSGNSDKYPLLPFAMVRDDEREGRFVDQR